MSCPKNALNTTLKKMGRLDKMIIFSGLNIVTILSCVFLEVSFQRRRRPIFLVDVFGLTHINKYKKKETKEPARCARSHCDARHVGVDQTPLVPSTPHYLVASICLQSKKNKTLQYRCSSLLWRRLRSKLCRPRATPKY
jgi:hypothetical protein